MILSFDNDVAELEKAIGVQIPPERRMAVAMVLAGVLDRGMATEQKRIVDIVKRHAMNPLPLLQQIRRPVR